MGMLNFAPGHVLEFTYTNHEGRIEARRMIFESLGYGSNQWYPAEQYFLNGICHPSDRNGGERRSFALDKIEGLRLA